MSFRSNGRRIPQLYERIGGPSVTEKRSCLRMDVLIVEDHGDTAAAMSMALRSMGHRTRIATSIAEALELLLNQKIDLIISDVGLPDGSGLSFINGVRAFCDAPAIAVTGFASSEDAECLMAAGFNKHLPKPFDLPELEAAIRDVASDTSNGDTQRSK